jgi:hypothetical protein
MTQPDDSGADLMVSVLRGFDDPAHAEAPADFDYVEAKQRFLELAQAVNRLVGAECDVDVWPGIQDASHHGEIVLPSSATTAPERAVIRVSNFGGLATFFDETNDVVKPDLLPRLIRVIERAGYRYVAPALLARRYDGRLPRDRIPTWGTRYFDYL